MGLIGAGPFYQCSIASELYIDDVLIHETLKMLEHLHEPNEITNTK